MRSAFSTTLLLCAAPLFFACSTPTADEGDAVESTDEALAATGRKVTTHYEGTFTNAGETFTVSLDIELPTAAIGYQHSDSTRWNASDSPNCRVYNEWTRGTMTLRVLGADGRVVGEKISQTGTGGFEQLDPSTECPEGFLVNPRVYSRIDAHVEQEGVGFKTNGHTMHVPSGYFSPGFLYVDGSATFRALSSGKLESKTEGGYNKSNFDVARGVIRLGLADETKISVGIDPGTNGLIYNRLVDVTLRARGR